MSEGGTTERIRYAVGLDLGQAQDFSALAVVERRETVVDDPAPADRLGRMVAWSPSGLVPLSQAMTRGVAMLAEPAPPRPRPARVLHVRHLLRFPLGTGYPTIVAGVVELLARPPLTEAGTTLAIDRTGVGRAVFDLFRVARLGVALRGVTITAGGQAVRDQDGWKVPKRDLVGSLAVALQSGELKVAEGLPEARLLAKEMANFRAKITAAGHASFEAWRDGDHDDLVLAVALACWSADRPAIRPRMR